jgi:hypothetical protein
VTRPVKRRRPVKVKRRQQDWRLPLAMQAR